MPGSSFDDVYVVNPSRLRPASADDVTRLESDLGCRMPSGYADYVTRLGSGSLGHFVRVTGPTELLARTLEWRRLYQEHWFWDTTAAEVDRRELQEGAIVVGDSFDGDELLFHPADSEVLFVLPRHDDVIHRVGPGFTGALDWMLSGTVLNSWVEGWTFEAPVHRAHANIHTPSVDELAAARARLEALGEHDHVVDLGWRRTYFLPAIQGRVSLFQLEDGEADVDFTYDDAADPATVQRILAAVSGPQ